VWERRGSLAGEETEVVAVVVVVVLRG